MKITDFTRITHYEECPLDVQLLVWTGDGFEVEYVVVDSDTGNYYPANGVEFNYYIECPISDFEKVPYYDDKPIAAVAEMLS